MQSQLSQPSVGNAGAPHRATYLLQVTEALVASRGVVNRVLNYPVHAEAVSLASQVTWGGRETRMLCHHS